eukprot:119542_1
MANQDEETITLSIFTGQRSIQLSGVSVSWTVSRLKQHLCDREGENPRGITFRFRGKAMNDDMRLSQFGIRNGSSITMTIMLMGGGGPDDEKKENINMEGADERQAFLNESVRKKQYYNQYTSLTDYANTNINRNNIDKKILVKDPHFVLTLNDLNDFGVNINNNNEINKLKQLKNCIKNKLKNPIIDNMRTKLATVYQVDAARVIITDIYYGTTNIGYVIVDYEANGVVTLIKNAKEFESKMKSEFKSFKEMIITPPPECVDGTYAIVKTFHVSCASGKACGKWDCPQDKCRLVGVVLYMK